MKICEKCHSIMVEVYPESFNEDWWCETCEECRTEDNHKEINSGNRLQSENDINAAKNIHQ